MANTIKHFKGNGSQKKFNFGMDYLQKNFIKLSVSFVDKVYGVDYTITDQEIDILIPPAMDADVFIRRETSSKPLVTWHDATVLTATDMTMTEIQVLHLQEEVSDAVKTDAKENAQIATEQATIATQQADKATKEADRSFDSAETSAKRTVEDSKTLLQGYEKSCLDAKDTIVPLVPVIQQGVKDADEALVDAKQAMADVRSLGAVPVGTVAMFLTDTMPSGFLCLSGSSRVSTFDPALYPDLYKALGNINTLPDCTNKFPQGAGDKIKGSAVKTWRLPAFETDTTGEHVHAPVGTPGANFLVFLGSGGTVGTSAGSNTRGSILSSAGDHKHTLAIPVGNVDTYLAPDAFGVYWGIKAYGIVSTEGMVQVQKLVDDVETLKNKGGIPVGNVVSFFSEVIPSGYLLLSGANRVKTYDRYVFPDLFLVLGTETLPDCTNRFPQGAGENISGGSVKSWRLPSFETNITGEHTHSQQSVKNASLINSGGVDAGKTYTTIQTGPAGDHKHSLSIPPANLDTYLAPNAFGVFWAIKAFGGIVTEGVAQVSSLVKQVDSLQKQLDTTSGTRVWISPYITTLPATLTHDITSLDLRKAQVDIGIEMTSAVLGYSIGDTFFSFNTFQGTSGSYLFPVSPILNLTTISFAPPSTLYLRDKTTGNTSTIATGYKLFLRIRY